MADKIASRQEEEIQSVEEALKTDISVGGRQPPAGCRRHSSAGNEDGSPTLVFLKLILDFVRSSDHHQLDQESKTTPSANPTSTQEKKSHNFPRKQDTPTLQKIRAFTMPKKITITTVILPTGGRSSKKQT
jgi:hypothetical protein